LIVGEWLVKNDEVELEVGGPSRGRGIVEGTRSSKNRGKGTA
jgi:hypothetical protein